MTATLNGQPQQTGTGQRQFVPAQFFAMTDDEKLASPSFEEMEAGVVFGSDRVVFDELQTVAAPLEYESIVIDAAGQSSKAPDKYRAERLAAHGTGPSERGRRRRRFAPSGSDVSATPQRRRPPLSHDGSLGDRVGRGHRNRDTGAGRRRDLERNRAAMAALNRGASAGSAPWQLVPLHELLPR